MDIDTLKAYDQQPEVFAKDWHDQPAPVDLQALVRQFFAPGPTADVGSGSGRDTAWLTANGYPAQGFEPSDGLLEQARLRYPDITFHKAALPHLAGADEGSFTNVLCETVIMHLEAGAVGPSVRKLVALLRPQGTLYLSWRVTKGGDRRDEYGRLYAAFDTSKVKAALDGTELLLDEEKVSASSGKIIHRLVARKL